MSLSNVSNNKGPKEKRKNRSYGVVYCIATKDCEKRRYDVVAGEWEWEASSKPTTKNTPATLRKNKAHKTTYLRFIVWAGHVTIESGQNSRPTFKQTVVEIFGVQTFRQFQPMVKTTVAYLLLMEPQWRERPRTKTTATKISTLAAFFIARIAAVLLLLTGVHGQPHFGKGSPVSFPLKIVMLFHCFFSQCNCRTTSTETKLEQQQGHRHHICTNTGSTTTTE